MKVFVQLDDVKRTKRFNRVTEKVLGEYHVLDIEGFYEAFAKIANPLMGFYYPGYIVVEPIEQDVKDFCVHCGLRFLTDNELVEPVEPVEEDFYCAKLIESDGMIDNLWVEHELDFNPYIRMIEYDYANQRSTGALLFLDEAKTDKLIGMLTRVKGRMQIKGDK